MPFYEYLCEANGRVVEVSHKMNDRIKTWGELCQRADVSPGKTDPKAPVTKLMSAGFVSAGSSAPACESGACGMGPCGIESCGSGMCGLQ